MIRMLDIIELKTTNVNLPIPIRKKYGIIDIDCKKYAIIKKIIILYKFGAIFSPIQISRKNSPPIKIINAQKNENIPQ
jgi:hypothetical protein